TCPRGGRPHCPPHGSRRGGVVGGAPGRGRHGDRPARRWRRRGAAGPPVRAAVRGGRILRGRGRTARIDAPPDGDVRGHGGRRGRAGGGGGSRASPRGLARGGGGWVGRGAGRRRPRPGWGGEPRGGRGGRRGGVLARRCPRPPPVRRAPGGRAGRRGGDP